LSLTKTKIEGMNKMFLTVAAAQTQALNVCAGERKKIIIILLACQTKDEFLTVAAAQTQALNDRS
jgi:predicted secreted protein